MSDLSLPRYRIDPSAPEVTCTPYVCPWCLGHGRWRSGEGCIHCASTGLTDDPSPGVDLAGDYGDQEPPTVEARRLPRPPAVMRKPCVDCAYRSGSPEEDVRPGPEKPFFCHHGLHRVGDSYHAPAQLGTMPLGAMVCAGWWALLMGEERPAEPFRDPGGADRPEAAPELPPGVDG